MSADSWAELMRSAAGKPPAHCEVEASAPEEDRERHREALSDWLKAPKLSKRVRREFNSFVEQQPTTPVVGERPLPLLIIDELLPEDVADGALLALQVSPTAQSALHWTDFTTGAGGSAQGVAGRLLQDRHRQQARRRGHDRAPLHGGRRHGGR